MQINKSPPNQMIRILFTLLFGLLAITASLATDEAGLAFLAAKGKEEGVVTLPSGLLYKEITPGTGRTPTINSPCDCHYAGTLIDGTEFDSSYKRGQPLTFAPNQVIKGWTEGLQLMKPGAVYRFVIPSDLAYGDSGAGSVIPAGATLTFEVELISIEKP